MLDVRQLEAVAFAAVDIEHGEGDEGCTEGGEAEDEHRCGVTWVRVVGTAYEHGDDGAAEVLDEEYHGVGGAEALQWDDFRHAGPECSGCQRIADAEGDH